MKNCVETFFSQDALLSKGQATLQYTGTVLLDQHCKVKSVSSSLLANPEFEKQQSTECCPFYFLAAPDATYILNEIQEIVTCNGSSKELLLQEGRKENGYFSRYVRITNLLDVEAVKSMVCQFYVVSKKGGTPIPLTDSEVFYRTIFTFNPLPIFICSHRNLQILEVNKEAQKTFGYSRKELVSMALHQMEHDPADKKVKLLEENYAAGNLLRSEIMFATKGGEALQCELTAYGLYYKGQPVYLVMVNNITPLILLQNALTKEKVDRQKLIAKATVEGQEKHCRELGMELHDSINPVLASVKLLLHHGLSTRTDLPQMVEKSIHHIEKVIEENRRLSKNLAPASLEDSGLTEAVLEIVQSLRIVTKISVEPQLQIYADDEINNPLKVCVFRIIQEQVNNIIKYALATRIKIKLVQRPKSLELLVKDNGIGFDVKAKRNGIGINNIHNRAEMFNGKVQLKSEPSKGCSLQIVFPL